MVISVEKISLMIVGYLEDQEKSLVEKEVGSLVPDILAARVSVMVHNFLFRTPPLTPHEIKTLFVMVDATLFSLPHCKQMIDQKHPYHVLRQLECLYGTMKGRDKKLRQTAPFNSGSGVARFLHSDYHGANEITYVCKPNRLPLSFSAIPQLGEACKREKLSFLLDRNGFAGVPPTYCILFDNEEYSLQYFIKGCEDIDKCGEFGDYGLPLKTTLLRPIMIHNLIMLNLDVNNIIVKADGTPIPIDYGYCLPPKLTSHAGVLNVRFPEGAFTQKEKEYIANFSLAESTAFLEAYHIDGNAISLHKMMVTLLKSAIERPDVTLGHLNSLFYQGYYEHNSYSALRSFTSFRRELLRIAEARNKEEQEERMDAAFKIVARKV